MSGSLPASSSSLQSQATHSCNLSRQGARLLVRLNVQKRQLSAPVRLQGQSRSCRACLGSEYCSSREVPKSTRAFASDSEPSSRLPTQGEALVRGIGGDDDSRGVQLMERSKPPADIDYLAVQAAALRQWLLMIQKTVLLVRVCKACGPASTAYHAAKSVCGHAGAHCHSAEWTKGSGLLWDQEYGIPAPKSYRDTKLRHGTHGAHCRVCLLTSRQSLILPCSASIVHCK